MSHPLSIGQLAANPAMGCKAPNQAAHRAHRAHRAGANAAGCITRIAALAALVVAPLQASAQTVFSGNGDVAGLTPLVNDFRAALGALNPNQPVSFAGGRREINWDAVPDARSDPNAFPGNFFNANVSPRARGVVLSTPGLGFAVSAKSSNPTGTPAAFGFAAEFIPFSNERMFTPVGSVITDVSFFLPSDQTTRAGVRGFGSVFESVETTSTQIGFFDSHDQLLRTLTVAHGAASSSLSFAGLLFDAPVIARVRITSGSAMFLGNGQFSAGADAVVMDDFLFAEPTVAVPEPGTWALMLAGGLGLAALGQRRKARAALPASAALKPRP